MNEPTRYDPSRLDPSAWQDVSDAEMEDVGPTRRRFGVVAEWLFYAVLAALAVAGLLWGMR